MWTRPNVLCPVDFSDQSRVALRWAGALAARYQGRLIVLSVVEPLLAEAARMRFGVDQGTTETEPALREFVRTTWPNGVSSDARTVFDVRIGDPSDVIVETATDNAVDVIVMGTHGLGGFRKWLIGSTTEAVLRSTQTPVLGVPPAADGPSLSSDNDLSIQNLSVLAATDFRESSDAALVWASQFAQQFDLPLVLAHVVEPLTVPPHLRSYVQQSDEDRVADARARLDRLGRELCGERACEAVVWLGRPEESLPAIAQERRSGLIVMGLARKDDSPTLRPGSIAYGVLRTASVPVLVVPASSHPKT